MARSNSHRRQVAFLFQEGDGNNLRALGGKGAGLAELVKLGMPVPPGYTITTSVARAFAQHGQTPSRLQFHMQRGIAQIEQQTGKRFGDAHNPLLLSVRSGAAVSMPGMMDTVLNLGLNRQIAEGLAAATSERFAWDCYRRFLSMFGEIVLGIPRSFFTDVLQRFGPQPDGRQLKELCLEYRRLIELLKGPMVDDPREQLGQAVLAVLRSWNTPRAQEFRRVSGIRNDLGTAVNVQSMVYGNRDARSGTGVAFSRNVATGERGLWGEFLCNAQGEDVVAGSRTPLPIIELSALDRSLYRQLEQIVQHLDEHRRQVVDVEFTVESGRLYILQVRGASLAPQAAATVATQLVWERKLSRPEALKLVSPAQVQILRGGGFQSEALAAALGSQRLLHRGLPASPGVAVGTVVTTSSEAVAEAARGRKVILVRPDTCPDDLPGMLAAAAIVTRTGGTTCHAAVVARGLGKPAVVGCTHLNVSSGQVLSVDANQGAIIDGELPLSDTSLKKEVNIFLRWVAAEEAKRYPKPRLAFEMFDQSVPVGLVLSDFYLTDHMNRAASGTALADECAQLRTSVHAAAAERLAMYLTAAVGGELRHAQRLWAACAEELSELTGQFKVQLDRNDRAEAQRVPVNQLKSMSGDQHVRFLQLASDVFRKGPWSSSFGGVRWAVIAEAAHGFLTGRLTHSVFADHAFDLQHNTGRVFGKNYMLTDYTRVHQQLEAKKVATTVGDLHSRLSAYNRPSPEVEALYRKGERAGLWGQAVKKAGV